MDILIIVFFIGILSIIITLYALLRKEINNVAEQLSKINNSEDTNSKILMTSNNKVARRLVLEINKLLEKKIKTQVDYRRMDKELRQAIANISHDLRTPLTSIMGYLQLMGDRSIPIEEQEQYRVIVEKRAKSLQMLITSFYDLSRLEANEYNFELKPIKINNEIYDTIASFYNDLLAKEIEPTIEVDDKPITVIGDENAVRRVFSNLMQNIIKYGDKKVFICSKEYEDRIITIFKNDGCTLKSENVENLFQRFFTGDKSRSEQSTGLGLAITKRLVEQMGHNIYGDVKEGELTITIEWKKLKN